MLFLKTPFLQSDESNVRVTVRTQPDNRGHIRETFADSLTASSSHTEEGHGHVPPSTRTGKTELTNGWRHMVFIFRVKIHSCQYLFLVCTNFKGFMNSVLLTSFWFPCSAFRGYFPVCACHWEQPYVSRVTRFPVLCTFSLVFLAQAILRKMSFARTRDGH